MDAESALSTRDVKMEDTSHEAPLLASTTGKGSISTADTPRTKPYRSWKKKFQKMRVEFDEKMELNETLHTQEVVAMQTTKRLAVEMDRLLDLLLDINNTPQIPASKRIDLSLPLPAKGAKALDIDVEGGWEKRFYNKSAPNAPLPEAPTTSLRNLIRDVPHIDLAETAKMYPSRLKDLVPSVEAIDALTSPEAETLVSKKQTGANDAAVPTSLFADAYADDFLAADDVDNYLWEVDRIAAGRSLLAGVPPPPMIPTLAPFAHTPDTYVPTTSKMGGTGGGADGWEEFFSRSISKQDLPSILTSTPTATARDSILKNPTSVYNWLKKHAPKQIFLQEGEASAAAAAAAAVAAAAAAAASTAAATAAGAGDDDAQYDYHHYYGSSQNGGGGPPVNAAPSTGRKRKTAAAARSGGGGGNRRVSALIAAGADDAATVAATTPSPTRAPTPAAAGGGAHDSDDVATPLEPSTPQAAPAAVGGKRKRASASAAAAAAAALDDDAGYRPTAAGSAASTSRAAKRKRKSEVKAEDDAAAATTADAAAAAAGGGPDAAAGPPSPPAVLPKKRPRTSTSGRSAAAAAVDESAMDVEAEEDMDVDADRAEAAPKTKAAPGVGGSDRTGASAGGATAAERETNPS